jgi:hypothetical protein
MFLERFAKARRQFVKIYFMYSNDNQSEEKE